MKRHRERGWRVAAALGDLELTRDPAGRLPYVVTDRAGQQQVRLDPVGAATLASLERELEPRALHGEVERRLRATVPPRLLARHVQHLTRSFLLQGPRSATWRALVEAASAAVSRAEQPLLFLAGLQHECQACGGCCLGTDVGPLPEALVERLEAHDWGDRLPAARQGVSLFRRADLDGRPIWLTGSSDDGCVFLREDRLCQIHAELGAAAKPSMCRQFPYLFTQVPEGIAVSVALECRAWLAAKRTGTPPEQQQPILRELLEAGAFVQAAPAPHLVAPGVPVDGATSAALLRDLMAAFDGPGDPVERASQAGEAVVEWVGARTAGWPEPWLEAAQWAATWPAAFPEIGADEGPTFARRLEALHGRLAAHLVEEGQRHADAGHALEAERFRLFRRALQAVHEGAGAQAVGRSAALDEVLRDTWRAAVFAREPLQSGALSDGLARIHARLLLIRALAMLRARDGQRLHLVDQDCVDSMVVVNKMSRQRSVARLLRDRSDTLSYLYFDNLSALSAGSVPRPASLVTGLLAS